MVKAEMQPMGGEGGSEGGVANQGGGASRRDIKWSKQRCSQWRVRRGRGQSKGAWSSGAILGGQWRGSEGGVANQGGVVIRSDLGAGSKRSCGQWGAGGGPEGGVAKQGGLAKAARRVERMPVRGEGGLIRGVN